MRKSSYRAEDVFNLDALIEYVVNCDEFTQAVGQSVEAEVENLVESAIDNADIPSLVEEALPDYSREISDLSDEVGRLEIKVSEVTDTLENLQGQVYSLTGLIKGLQEQNHALFVGIGEVERRVEVLEGVLFIPIVRRLKNFLLTIVGH